MLIKIKHFIRSPLYLTVQSNSTEIVILFQHIEHITDHKATHVITYLS